MNYLTPGERLRLPQEEAVAQTVCREFEDHVDELTGVP